MEVKTTPAKDTIFYLNWIRESSSGVVDVDLGTRVASAQLELALINLLPHQQSGKPWTLVSMSQVDEWIRWPDFEQQMPHWVWRKLVHFFGRQPLAESVNIVRDLAARIRGTAQHAGLTECELYLPYGDRRIWNHRWGAFPMFTFEVSWRPGLRPAVIGRVGGEPLVDPFSVREMALRTASAAILKVKPKGPLYGEVEFTPPLPGPWNAGVFEHYQLGISPDACAPLSLLRFMQAEGTLLQAWYASPRERQTNYYAAFSRMSLAVQTAVRRFLLASFASQAPDAFANFDHGADVLVYAAIKPYTEKRASDFSYDVLNPEQMEAAFGRAARRLEPLLEMAAASLKPMEHHEETARRYVKNDVRLNANRMVNRANRRPRIRTMLVAESTMIYSMIRFANRIKLLDGPKEINDLVDLVVRDFDDRLRRIFFFRPEQGPALGRMLFLEAVNALQFEQTREQALEVTAVTADGTEHRHRNPFSESLGVLG